METLFFIASLLCAVAVIWIEVRRLIADAETERSYFEQRRSGILKPGDLN